MNQFLNVKDEEQDAAEDQLKDLHGGIQHTQDYLLLPYPTIVSLCQSLYIYPGQTCWYSDQYRTRNQ